MILLRTSNVKRIKTYGDSKILRALFRSLMTLQKRFKTSSAHIGIHQSLVLENFWPPTGCVLLAKRKFHYDRLKQRIQHYKHSCIRWFICSLQLIEIVHF